MRPGTLPLLLCLLWMMTGCYKVSDTIQPKIDYLAQESYLRQLPPTFHSLSTEERREGWGKEYLIAQKFARELDFYRAITTFKRAEFLLPEREQRRFEEIQYQILLSYYLGKRYHEVLQVFDRSHLYNLNASFPAYHDLLLILYESYLKMGQREKSEYTLKILQHHYPETAKRVQLSTMLLEGNFEALKKEAEEEPSIAPCVTALSDNYYAKKKSVSKAQWANALIPGAGYLYVGQKQSAITSFLLNTLFIYAAAHFYMKGNIAAGILTTSFEMGWYFGGIYGAGEAAKQYNEHLYAQQAYPILTHNRLFTVLMLKYGF